jgi:DNA-binding LacI/PurR family transcriptional regulator
VALASKVGSAATASDVARLAGVSTATVSRALNSPEIVTPETRARVYDAIDRLEYRPNTAARRLAGSRTYTIGLTVPELSGPFFSELLAGVEEGSRAAGFHLLVAATEPDTVATSSLPSIDPTFVDGSIVLPDAMDDRLVDRLAASATPTVLVEVSHPRLPTVAFDGATGAAAAVRHLVVDHGARRVVCLAGPAEAEASRHRETAWAAVLRAAGLEPDPDLLVRGTWSEVDGMRLVDELLAAGRQFDALFAVNDETAIGAMRGLERAGLHVPDDVRVCGFDDIPVAGWMRPALTTVAAPPRDLGRTAVEILVARIAKRPTPLATRLPTSLVVRSTCGCVQEEERVP